MGKSTARWTALVLALAVFSAGLVVSCVVFNVRTSAHQHVMREDFEGTATQYAFMVQRHLDAYAATNRSLAAYVSASTDIDARGLKAFIRTAGYFERMQGLSSLGFAPRVPRQQAAAFERRAGAEFPGYRIREARPGADFFYPLLYGEDASSSVYMDAARGADLSSMPVRHAAIEAAEASGMPAVTQVHASMHHKQAHIVLTFTPVATLPGAMHGGQGSGVVYTAMNVDKLFAGTDNGRIDSAFDLEVYQVENGHRSLVYDADRVPHVNVPGPLQQFVHSSALRYADKTWVL
jgi:CHASE1-domain containing sensor protein